MQQRNSIKDLEEGAGRLNEDLRKRDKTAQNLQARISDLEAEVSGLTEDAAAMAQRLEAAHKEIIDALEARINQRDEELEKLTEQLESAKQESEWGGMHKGVAVSSSVSTVHCAADCSVLENELKRQLSPSC